MNDDDATRCPLTLDWVRQANDTEAGDQLSLFDLLYVELASTQETVSSVDAPTRWAVREERDDSP